MPRGGRTARVFAVEQHVYARHVVPRLHDRLDAALDRGARPGHVVDDRLGLVTVLSLLLLRQNLLPASSALALAVLVRRTGARRPCRRPTVLA